MASRLKMVKRGVLSEPLRFLFYSPEGVGKSTLGSRAPNPIFLDIEDGTGRLDVARYPFRDGPGGHVPESLDDIMAAIEDLRVGEHSYQTLVIDTVDRLESLVWAWVVQRYSGKRDDSFNKGGAKVESIAGFGFGKGYEAALDKFREICARLDELRRQRSMQIVILGHTHVRTFKNPRGEDFDRYQPRLHDKAAGFLKEWCDVMGFCAFEDGTSNLVDGRPKGISTGRRLIHLERTAAFDAKARIPLPSEVEIAIDDPWAPLALAIEAGRNTSAEDLATSIRAELARIGDPATAEKVEKAIVDARGDTAELSRYLNALKRRESVQQRTNEQEEKAA